MALGWVVVDGQVWQVLGKNFGILCIQKHCTEFGFGSGCSNEFEDGALDMDGAVEFDGVAIPW